MVRTPLAVYSVPLRKLRVRVEAHTPEKLAGASLRVMPVCAQNPMKTLVLEVLNANVYPACVAASQSKRNHPARVIAK